MQDALQLTDYTFLRAELAHIPLLVQLRIDFLADYWGPQEEAKTTALRNALNDYFTEALKNETYVAFVAFMDSVPVATGGMVISHKPGSFRVPVAKCAYIMNMYTHPLHRRKGLAEKILNLLLQTGEDTGVTIFDLHATAEGEPLYQKAGFEFHKEPSYRKIQARQVADKI